MRGAILCFPNLDPIKKANESFAQTDTITAKVSHGTENDGSYERNITMVEYASEVYIGPKQVTATSARLARGVSTYQAPQSISSMSRELIVL